MKRLRIGVIGCGLVAQVMHLPHLRDLDDLYEVGALCDLSSDVLAVLGPLFRVDCCLTDWRQLVALPDLDAVLISTPGSHAEAAIAAAQAGKHILVEKPMCLSLTEADAMVAAAEEAGVTLMVAYMKRYDPGYRYAREVIRGLRDVRYVQVNVLHPTQAPNFVHHRLYHVSTQEQFTLARMDPVSRATVRAAIGDVPESVAWNFAQVLLGSIIHDIDALGGFFGPPSRILFTDLWDDGKSLTTTFAYPGETRAVLTWTFLDELRHYDEEIAVMAPDARVRIRFPSPYFRNMPTPVVIEGMDGEANWTKTVTVSYEEAFKEELRHFHACVTTGARPETDGHVGRQDIAVGLDIYDAYARSAGYPLANRG
jgi:predicted dehydrogenase